MISFYSLPIHLLSCTFLSHYFTAWLDVTHSFPLSWRQKKQYIHLTNICWVGPLCARHCSQSGVSAVKKPETNPWHPEAYILADNNFKCCRISYSVQKIIHYNQSGCSRYSGKQNRHKSLACLSYTGSQPGNLNMVDANTPWMESSMIKTMAYMFIFKIYIFGTLYWSDSHIIVYSFKVYNSANFIIFKDICNNHHSQF